MADRGRKDFTTQAMEKATPDSHKTTGQKIKEKVTGAADKVMAAVTPDSHKSAQQQAADRARGAEHHHGHHTTTTGHHHTGAPLNATSNTGANPNLPGTGYGHTGTANY